jgi:hypothetical protein
MISDVERATGFYHESTVAVALPQIQKALNYQKDLAFRAATKEEARKHALPSGLWFTWDQREQMTSAQLAQSVQHQEQK